MTPEQESKLDAELTKFTEGFTAIVDEGTQIVLKGAESLSLFLSDPEVAEKIKESAAAISGAYGTFAKTYVTALEQMAETITEDLDSYDGLTRRFAVRHPLKALTINGNMKSIKESWAKIVTIFSPEPEKEEEEEKPWAPTPLQLDNIRFLEKNMMAQSQFEIERLDSIFSAADRSRQWKDSMTYTYFLSIYIDWSEELKKQLGTLINHLINTGNITELAVLR